MKKYNIFIVGSPLQLFNGIEASHYFKTTNNILLLLHVCEEESIAQIEKLLNFMTWSDVIYISIPKQQRESITFPSKLKKILKEIPLGNKIEKIFVGEYRNDYVTHIIHSLNNKNIYLLDDGLGQINYHQKVNHFSYKSQIKKIVYKHLLFYKLKKIKYTFFTIFNIENEKYIKNCYEFFKQSIAKKDIVNTVYFIGQPLVELNILSETEYKNELSKIIKFYRGKKFVYILHRRQDKQKIHNFSKELNFEYKEFENLIELEMINSTTIPSDFATFFSTAIVTLPHFIQEAEYRVFRTENKYINKKYLPSIKVAYKEFSDIGLKVEEL